MVPFWTTYTRSSGDGALATSVLAEVRVQTVRCGPVTQHIAARLGQCGTLDRLPTTRICRASLGRRKPWTNDRRVARLQAFTKRAWLPYFAWSCAWVKGDRRAEDVAELGASGLSEAAESRHRRIDCASPGSRPARCRPRRRRAAPGCTSSFVGK